MSIMYKSSSLKKMVLLSLMTTVSLIIFIIEAQIPLAVTIPGIKLGLANIVTLILINDFKKHEVATVLILRIILGSLFSGQIMTFFYSLSGGIMCFIAMSICNKILKENALWFTSIVGALFHNIGQILIAMLILKSVNVIYYFPFLMISAIITGLLTGITAQMIIKKIKKIIDFEK